MTEPRDAFIFVYYFLTSLSLCPPCSTRYLCTRPAPCCSPGARVRPPASTSSLRALPLSGGEGQRGWQLVGRPLRRGRGGWGVGVVVAVGAPQLCQTIGEHAGEDGRGGGLDTVETMLPASAARRACSLPEASVLAVFCAHKLACQLLYSNGKVTDDCRRYSLHVCHPHSCTLCS
jgi:hypothetical protein